jgi:hypothetical protein
LGRINEIFLHENIFHFPEEKNYVVALQDGRYENALLNIRE